ncbi:ATP-dependent DNA helicase [Litchfieldella xinjiangensis]|uniref:ATP-dependent DNA helicase n=1 Tax=Litchfieldella xinjiangensis TaxID=1166948 RepID=UPI0005BC3563|nr:ATP-dependent DNA helicase [Halomonas xinjiangensis]
MTYRIAVRALCEFTAREGDLDHRFTPSPSAQEGIAGHTLIAERRRAEAGAEGYETEVALSGDYGLLRVSGRADGYDPRRQCLEEVKTHRGSLERMGDNQRALHWAQVRVYGALLCRERGLDSVTLALVYLDIATGRETRLTESATALQLETFFTRQCERFLAWAEQEAAHRQARDAALHSLRFPFADFRHGQRPLSEAVYKAVSTQRHLMIQAPTGIGKTLGTLFPMLVAMPRHALDRVFFLTMKTTGRRLALEAAEKLGHGEGEQGLPLRVLELIARDRACEHPGTACHGEACPLARGFYDRLPAARQAAVDRGGVLDQAALREVALAHDICPYYLGQELARWSDLVVGDVNHYFDMNAMLFALSQVNGWRVGVLVDEAHNLVERARGMYSATLEQQRVNALRRHAPSVIAKPLGRVARRWNEMLKEAANASGETAEPDDYQVLAALPQRLLMALQQAASTITDYLAEQPAGDVAGLTDFLFEALHVCRLAERFGGHSICDVTRHARGRAVLTLRNVVPADFLAPRLAATHAAVLFSATLGPAEYYRDLLGLPCEAPWLEVDSPFAAHQLEVRLAQGISTRFRDRERSIAPIVATLAEQYRCRPGNYLAFFSSFAYLDAVVSHFTEAHPDVPVWTQRRGMQEAARQAFIDGFVPGGCGIGFAVLGGAFAEGIDLPGDRLIGAFVATLGMPPFDAVNEQLRQRMQARFGRGYDYTYHLPGLTKVVQAAGRVIRSPDDRGVVVLIDDRFARTDVQVLLPRWWRDS